MFQTQTAATHECIKIDLSMVTFFTQTRLHTFVYQRNGDNVHVLSSFMANRWKCDLLQFRFEKATHTHTLAFTHIHFSGKRIYILNGLFTACDVSVCFFFVHSDLSIHSLSLLSVYRDENHRTRSEVFRFKWQRNGSSSSRCVGNLVQIIFYNLTSEKAHTHTHIQFACTVLRKINAPQQFDNILLCVCVRL